MKVKEINKVIKDLQMKVKNGLATEQDKKELCRLKIHLALVD